jgi:hypothetical protein
MHGAVERAGRRSSRACHALRKFSAGKVGHRVMRTGTRPADSNPHQKVEALVRPLATRTSGSFLMLVRETARN